MQIIYVNQENIQALQSNPTSSAMALGYFDGVHLGHRKLIESAKVITINKELALSVLSFFPHPKSVLSPSMEMKYLEPLDERISKMEALEVDIYYIVKFDQDFARIEPDAFIKDYVIGLGAKDIVCGFDYSYGTKARGTVSTLKEYEQIGIDVTVVDEQKEKNNKISSTIIRECLDSGKVHEIPKYLGEYYKTKYCCKNGFLQYYTVPAPGKYKVLIEMPWKKIESKVIVTADRKLKYDSLLSAENESFTVSWLENIG